MSYSKVNPAHNAGWHVFTKRPCNSHSISLAHVRWQICSGPDRHVPFIHTGTRANAHARAVALPDTHQRATGAHALQPPSVHTSPRLTLHSSLAPLPTQSVPRHSRDAISGLTFRCLHAMLLPALRLVSCPLLGRGLEDSQPSSPMEMGQRRA